MLASNNHASPSSHRQPLDADDITLMRLGHKASDGYFFTLDEELFLGKMIRLSRTDCSARATRRASRAKQYLAQANQRLVFKMANKVYSSYPKGTTREDVVSAGNLGLSRALEDYDDTMGNKLSTYATWWIRHYIQRLGHKIARIGTLPDSKIGIISDVKKETLRIEEEGRSVTSEEMKTILQTHGIDEAEYNKIMSFNNTPFSFDAPVFNDDSTEASEVMNYDDTRNEIMGTPLETPEGSAIKNDTISIFNKALSELTPLQQSLINMSYIEDRPMGVNGEIKRTQASIRRTLGVTKSVAERELQKGLAHLREQMTSYGYGPNQE
jgi:RNA polymerase primary sigma factor